MRTNTEAAQLLLLLTWMSPAFPTGAFVYSHGLEWAVGIPGTQGALLGKQCCLHCRR